jgi:hypothetical protein
VKVTVMHGKFLPIESGEPRSRARHFVLRIQKEALVFMDEQGVYCIQCRGYVHFWFLPRVPAVVKDAPGAIIDMPENCKQCGHKGTYKATDLRTRRVPTMPGLMVTPPPDTRTVSTIEVEKALKGEKV